MARENKQLNVKVQLFCGNEGAIGPDKAALLDAVERERSIAGAARLIGMSYRRAWLLVDAMNRCWHEKLVGTSAGGGADRGARVTEFGRTVLAAYRTLQASLDEAGAPGAARLLELLRAEPLEAVAPSNPARRFCADVTTEASSTE